MELYQEIVAGSAQIARTAKVKDVYCRGRWSLPHPMDPQVEDAWNLVKQQTLNENMWETITWKLTSNGKYSIASAWDHL